MKAYQFLLVTAAASTLLMTSCKKDDKTTATPDPVKPTDTTLSGEVSGTWTTNGTYHISGDIIIPEGKSLTIQAGAKVIFDADAKPEFLVKGNFYSLGTADAPVTLTVEDGKKQAFGLQWGGILAGPTCQELVLDHTIIEQGGNVTTEASASVKAGFYKAEAGDRLPVLWYGGTGKVVVTNCIVRDFAEDGFYIEGGSVLMDHNSIYTTGIDNGDAINIKSGVHADIAFNLVYGPNTNALKLSNSGDRPIQAYVFGYNNTVLNCGWRRPTTKGGSIWVEKLVRAEIYNNLIVNDRYGIKRDKVNPEDAASKFANNYYYGYDQTTTTQFQPTDEIIGGTNDIISAVVGANDPKFVSYPLNTDPNSATFSASWDFHLQSGSPAIAHGKTDFTPHFSTTGTALTFSSISKTYTSPAPATYIGAYSTK